MWKMLTRKNFFVNAYTAISITDKFHSENDTSRDWGKKSLRTRCKSLFLFWKSIWHFWWILFCMQNQLNTVMSRRYINYSNRLYMIMIENWRDNLLRGSWLHPFRFYRFLHECFKAKNAKNVLYFRYWGQTLAFVTPTDLFLEFGKVDCSKESRNSERKSWNWWR